MSKDNLELAVRFMKAVGDGKSGEELNEFYDESAVQIEYPNLLTKRLIERNLHEIKDASISGKKVIANQRYEIVKSFSIGDTVIIEAIWSGELSIPLGKLKAGDEMKAYFAQFFQFKNHKIVKQRNYDCFENFL
ncbi:hypothetical protein Sgly_2330 [Syntrophobotulus glycolicus DSM 8271]|uniref:SnoaL-like domain-containing protein n=1 Tax=Syntrophobotulus glycolicus (strain DSM 8271 / FlGlyR) TaxID=645991 RepID=F0SUG8_SYNGF|nr:hypothetical protein [Syntrophobotulus glycolicus]ADY56618.1 hypothetical protein Sgly_2330 [Syntrophobotulus glycolicus DSM 8271]